MQCKVHLTSQITSFASAAPPLAFILPWTLTRPLISLSASVLFRNTFHLGAVGPGSGDHRCAAQGKGGCMGAAADAPGGRAGGARRRGLPHPPDRRHRQAQKKLAPFFFTNEKVFQVVRDCFF